MVRVSVVGAKGRMGSHVVDAVNGAQDMQLAFALDAGDDLMRITPENTDVVVEFTVPSVSLDNVLALVKQGVDVVVGTTGWTEEKLAQVTCRARQQAPVAARACSSRRTSRFPPCWPTISPRSPRRTSNPRKSSNCTTHQGGRALRNRYPHRPRHRRSAQGGRPRRHAGRHRDRWRLRGQVVDGIHVHAVRLRGLNAHEEVLFGNAGEQLTIRADSFDRISFMPGVLLAVRKVADGGHAGLTVGLDQFLDL